MLRLCLGEGEREWGWGCYLYYIDITHINLPEIGEPLAAVGVLPVRSPAGKENWINIDFCAWDRDTRKNCCGTVLAKVTPTEVRIHDLEIEGMEDGVNCLLKNFLIMENSCCYRPMGIVLEYVLDTYQ
jgi:hypothetical protein